MVSTHASLVLLAILSPVQEGRNPVMAGADPHAIVVENRVWIYPTGGGAGGPQFRSYSSTDFRTWRDHGAGLYFRDVKWIDDDGESRHYAWAPSVAVKNGKYYFYYSVGPQGRTPSRIGVAVGTSPSGPFQDSGRVLLTGGNGFEAIDPMVFNDPKSGKSYFYAGGSAGAKLRIFEMKPDMISFAREIPVQTPRLFTEGAFVHYRNGTYYLSYSHGGWRDASYSGHYATSGTPYGPWRYGGAFLASDARHKGPGHHSIIQGPGKDRWFVVYHRWNDAKGNGPYNGSRQVAIDVLEHQPGGILKRVRMTDTVPTFQP